MSEWKEYRLGDLCTKIGSGATPRGGGESYKENGISLIRSQNILDFQFSYSGLAFIDDEQANDLKNVIVQENDVLLNITGDSVARVCKVPNKVLPARVNQHVAIIRSDEKQLNSNFLLYYLLKLKEHLLSISEIGATRRAITKEMIENLEIYIPPLPEQRAIASILSSLDDKIDLLHRQNATLEKMAETLFRQWFVERKSLNYDSYDLLDDHDLKNQKNHSSDNGEEAIEEWEVVKIESLISIGSGKGLKKESFIDNGLYSILGANGEIGRTNEFLFDEKLIYTGRVGTLGNIFRIENEKVWLSDNTLVIRPLKYFNFIYFILKNSHLEDYNVGSTQPLIRQSDIKEIEFIMPSKEKLDEFESFTEKIFNKIKSNQNQIRTLTALRDTLLPKLMNGEVKVKSEE